MPDWLKRRADTKHGEIPGDTPLEALRYVVIDTELTSLQHRSNRLLSVGAIVMQGASILLGQQFYRVVNPRVEIPAETIVIHQLRDQDVKNADEVSHALEHFRQFVAEAVLIGHFAHIDLKILRKEMAETGHTLDTPAIDTARVHHWFLRKGSMTEDLPMKLEKLDLQSVAKSYGLDPQNEHHALADAFLTARLWQKMIFALTRQRVNTLNKLLKIAAAK